MKNYLSIEHTLDATATDYVIGTDIAVKQLTGIQNTSGAVIYLQFNGGTGTFQIPDDGYWEPFQPIQGTVTIWGAGSTVCLLG